jgi:hypothetical protein
VELAHFFCSPTIPIFRSRPVAFSSHALPYRHSITCVEILEKLSTG